MKPYQKNLLLVIILSIALVIASAILILSICGVFPLENFFIEFSLFIIGLIVPSLINFAIKLSDTLPWQIELRHLLRTGQIKKHDEVRISFAYCFAVNVDGEYFLVMNSHGIGLYQCPAKTYRITEQEKSRLKQKFHCREDDNIKRNYSDYRFYVPVNHLKAFCADFFKTHNPEAGSLDYSKEFVASIHNQTLIDSHLFDNVSYHFKNRCLKKVWYDEYYQTYSLPLLDIFEVDLNEEQIGLLRKLRLEARQTNDYLFATPDEIKTNGVIKGVNAKQTIAFNVKNIL